MTDISKATKGEHYPECNERCTGGSHYLEGDKPAKRAKPLINDHAGIDCDRYEIHTVIRYDLTCRTCGRSPDSALDYLEAQEWADHHVGCRL